MSRVTVAGAIPLEGALGHGYPSTRSGLHPIFLAALLATVTMLFASLTAAILIRRGGSDWVPVQLPGIVWVNALVILASSALLELAKRSLRVGDEPKAPVWLGLAAGRGIKLVISADSHLCTGHPWEPILYGYIDQYRDNFEAVDWLFADLVRTVFKFRHTFHFSEDLPAEMAMGPEEQSALPSMTVEPTVFTEKTAEDYGTPPVSHIARPQEPFKEKKSNGKSPQPA